MTCISTIARWDRVVLTIHSEWQLRRLDVKLGAGKCDSCGHRSHSVKLALLAIYVHEFSESILKPAKPPDFQANTWEALNPTGSMAVWSDMADGFFTFGGTDAAGGDSRCLSGATLENSWSP